MAQFFLRKIESAVRAVGFLSFSLIPLWVLDLRL